MNLYFKYTGLAFQLLFFIIAGYWIGKWAAPYLNMSESNGSVLGLLVFLVMGLYRLVREVMTMNQK